MIARIKLNQVSPTTTRRTSSDTNRVEIPPGILCRGKMMQYEQQQLNTRPKPKIYSSNNKTEPQQQQQQQQNTH